MLEIGNLAFNNCVCLTDVNIDHENINYCFESGALFDKTKTKLIQYMSDRKEKSFTVPDGVVEIEEKAFYACSNLISLNLPSSIKIIGNSALEQCSNLKTINYAGKVIQWNKIQKGIWWDYMCPDNMAITCAR